MFKAIILMMGLACVVEAQLWRADYFKDELMRFSTQECWLNQSVTPKEAGVTRIVTVGDSTTLGVNSSRSMLDFKYDYHFQMDGSKAGYQGWPYLLNSLFKVHNATNKYQTLNFASDNFTLFPEGG